MTCAPSGLSGKTQAAPSESPSSSSTNLAAPPPPAPTFALKPKPLPKPLPKPGAKSGGADAADSTSGSHVGPDALFASMQRAIDSRVGGDDSDAAAPAAQDDGDWE